MVDEKTKEIVAKKNYMQHWMESSPDFQMVLDKNDKIMDINKAFEKFIGRSREDVIGTSIYEYLPKKKTEKAIAETVEKGKVMNIVNNN